MTRVAIAFLTKDRVELTKQSIVPVCDAPVDIFFVDGSETPEGREFPRKYCLQEKRLEQLAERLGTVEFHDDIKGGADAAVAYALTKMLADPLYDYVGIVESDVLLEPRWFELTMALFEGYGVGAVSARSYRDRVLFQRDGYAVMHNLGYGMVIWSRKAATLALSHFRTCWTRENRRAFAQLAGVDIGKFWAFRTGEHELVSDWNLDRVLAMHGMASLALTPSRASMIGQNLAEQGLELVTSPVEERRDEKAFQVYKDHLWIMRERPVDSAIHFDVDKGWFYFAHQLADYFHGEWYLHTSQGFGPFAYRSAAPGATLVAWLAGPLTVLAGGHGQIEILDTNSAYRTSPPLDTDSMIEIAVPAGISYREIRITALTKGVGIYGIGTREQQLLLRGRSFDWNQLPPMEVV